MDSTDPEHLRAQIRQALDREDVATAFASARELWALAPGPASAGLVLSSLPGDAVRARVRVLRSYTVEPAIQLLRAEAAAYGVDLEVELGPFNVWAQELLDPTSRTYAADPQILMLALGTRELSRPLWDGFAALGPDEVEAEVARLTSELASVVAAARSHSNAHILLCTLDAPEVPVHGVLDAQRDGQLAALARVNSRLREITAEHADVWLVDYARAMSGAGMRDDRRYASSRTPWSNLGALRVAKLWARHLVPLSGRVGKVLVLDLDNTLWGGVVGEDGIEGIALDDEHPGAAHRSLQRVALDLGARGVILAICSKNNLSDAKAVFDNHPGMLLRFDRIAAHRINWDDKASNLRAIADELNVGLDSLVFVDDNPVERQWVRRQLPSVTVVELPTDAYGYADAVRSCPVLERLRITAEDQARPQLYAADRQRAELQAASGSVEEFLGSLEMVMHVEAIGPRSLGRAAQLTQRTNQFNVTTIRRNESELAELATDATATVFLARLTDRLGDNGLIALVIARVRDDALDIDTLLMSCRVIGRGVDTALLAIVARVAAGRGLRRVEGRFVPTARNAPAADLFERHGFMRTHADELRYAAAVDDVPPLPDYLAIVGLEDLR